MYLNLLFKSVVLVLSMVLLAVGAKNLPSTKLHTMMLDNKHMKMSWMVNWEKREVMFDIENVFPSEGSGWFTIGFSKRGEWEYSDFCIFNQVGEPLMDAHSTNDKIFRDFHQDCEILRIKKSSVAFKRKFDSCDPQDLRMHEGTMYIIWDQGNGTIELPREIPLSQHVAPATKVQILRADKITIPEHNYVSVEVRLENVKIPPKETTYWCHIQKLDDFIKNKHHIVQFEPIITNRDLIHHMEVFHCETAVNVEIPVYSGDCDDMPEEAKVCSRVISLWAMGASTFTYPKEAGLPIGGHDYNPYIRLEMHFNNPNNIDGRIDNSGMRIKMTSKLRKFDAAIMELGLEYTDKMAIPEGLTAFPLSGYCIAECTAVALPATGITIFGSQLHTHLTGVRIMTRHFRNGNELLEVNRDDYYSHEFQEIRNLRRLVKVLPGDALVTTCFYTTTDRNNATLGGFSIRDEMCVNYIQYYPATKLEVCKSSVSEDTLSKYFSYMKIQEHQNIDASLGRSHNYRSIHWTTPRVDELYTMYIQEPLSMQCNKSDGNRFEGYNWEGVPITEMKIQAPNQDPLCENYNLHGIQSLEDGDCGYLGECIY